MHRALLIPEIVNSLVDCNRSEPGYLHTCLLVNSIFFHSAARFLWCRCGVDSSTKGFVTPNIRHLLQIAQRDKRRGQFYADFIKLLRVGEITPTNYEDARSVERRKTDGHVYFEELSALGLTWMSLEELSIIHFERSDIQQEGKLLQYLKPKLRALTLHCSMPIGDDFLKILDERCPELRSLALKPSIVKGGISRDGFARFLRSRRLEFLDLRADEHDWEEGWQEGMLAVLCTQSDLRQISIPNMDDDTVKQMASSRNAANDTAFPALQSLHTGLPASSLHHLHCVAPHLSSLSLDLRRFPVPASNSVLLYVSEFLQLSNLCIRVCKQTEIRGDDLIHLSQSCSSLSRLSIAKDRLDSDRPWSSDITNACIEAFAQNAVRLKELYLLFHVPQNYYPREVYLTEESLEALARNCIDLQRLWLTCDPNWWRLSNDPLNVLFPEVKDLRIAGPELRYELGYAFVDDIVDTAKYFVRRCPKLTEFEFLEPYGEEPFDEVIRDVLSSPTVRPKPRFGVERKD